MTNLETNAEAKLGYDPEEKDVDLNLSMLQGVDWHSLEGMKDDRQVSKVIAALGL